MCRFHIFITHLSASGHVGGFYSPATMNRAIMKMAERVSSREHIQTFRYMPKGAVEPGHMGDLFLLFWETSILISKEALLF